MSVSSLTQGHSGQVRTLLGNTMNGQQDSGRIMTPGTAGSGGEQQQSPPWRVLTSSQSSQLLELLSAKPRMGHSAKTKR
jgi:hypothetical protein